MLGSPVAVQGQHTEIGRSSLKPETPKAIIPAIYYVEATERFKVQADHDSRVQAQVQVQE